MAAEQPPAAAQNNELVVVTLNTWGLLAISKQRDARVDALCDWLADPLRHQRPPSPPSSDADADEHLLPFAATFWRGRRVDVVLLQEVWVAADVSKLTSAARRGGLPHSVHFTSGAFGSGLVTLSRHPITQAALRVFSARGDPCAVFSGDFYAAKGVGHARLAVGGDDPSRSTCVVDVFNTHLCSNYKHTFRQLPLLPPQQTKDAAGLAVQPPARPGRQARLPEVECADSGVRVPTDADAATRVAQVLELCDFVKRSTSSGSSSGGLIVLGGDLNSEPDTLEVALLRAQLPELTDAWAATAAWRASEEGSSSSAAANNNKGPGAPAVEGYTCRSPLCTYAPRRQVPERIDYVWTSGFSPLAVALDLARVPLVFGGHSFSDHLAVRAALSFGGPTAAAAPAPDKGGVVDKAASGVAALLLRRARPGSAGGGASAATEATTKAEGGKDDDDEAAVARAALVGAAVVLAEGAEEFAGLASGNTLIGGLILVTTLYTAGALPFLMPALLQWLVSSPLGGALCALALVVFGAGGFALFVAGFLAARSQQSALVMALRSHVMVMRAKGLVPVEAAAATS